MPRQGILNEWEGSVQLTSLLITNLDQLILILKILFTFVTKQVSLIRRTTVLSLPFQLLLSDLEKSNVFPNYLKSHIWQNPDEIRVLIEPFKEDVDVLLHVLLQLLGVHGYHEPADVAEHL